MREIDLAAFAAAHADGAVVIDVREPQEYVSGHVPGAKLLPLSQLPSRIGDLPKRAPVYVICASGSRSLEAAAQLARAGYDAACVAGGTNAWTAAGLPTMQGPRENAA